MSEQVPRTNQQTLVIGLGAIAVLLVIIVGVLIYFQSQSNSIPAPSSAAAGANNGTAATGAPAGMGTQPVSTEFDAKTATKVPAGTEPLAFVKAYHEALEASKYAEAYKMLPLDKQASYGNATAYEEQLKGYGITGYRLGKAVTKGDTVEVPAEQITPQMPITYTWAFKKVDGKWFVVSRTMGGTVE